MDKTLFHYTAFGLLLCSDLACPELTPVPAPPAPQSADIHILCCDLPEHLPGAKRVGQRGQLTKDQFQIQIPGVARYRISAGQTIQVDPDPQADPRDLRLYLLGMAFGAALYQRGALLLHASAVRIETSDGPKAVAFCGPSGAGKSTLAAALADRGLPVIGDDVGWVQNQGPGKAPLFVPGIPRMKLWRPSLEHFGQDPTDLIRDQKRTEKFHIPMDPERTAQPSPLSTVFCLERGEAALLPALDRQSAVADLLKNTYHPPLVQHLRDPASLLKDAVSLAQAVPIYPFRRPWDLAQLDSSLGLLLKALRTA